MRMAATKVWKVCFARETVGGTKLNGGCSVREIPCVFPCLLDTYIPLSLLGACLGEIVPLFLALHERSSQASHVHLHQGYLKAREGREASGWADYSRGNPPADRAWVELGSSCFKLHT